MSRAALLAVLLAALALAGCGGKDEGGHGSARLWITRDRGATLMLDTTVPAGQTLMRALRSKADVDTRYGGRFVQGIDGVEGSLSHQRDWFWFVNGLAGDRSAAEYRLRPGDIAWWDIRHWARDAETLRIVVGAFPEPFSHGFDGKPRPASVRYAPGLAAGARRVAHRIGAADVAPLGTAVPARANLFELVHGSPRFTAVLRSPFGGPSSPVRFIYSGNVDRLLSGSYTRRFADP